MNNEDKKTEEKEENENTRLSAEELKWVFKEIRVG